MQQNHQKNLIQMMDQTGLDIPYLAYKVQQEIVELASQHGEDVMQEAKSDVLESVIAYGLANDWSSDWRLQGAMKSIQAPLKAKNHMLLLGQQYLLATTGISL